MKRVLIVVVLLLPVSIVAFAGGKAEKGEKQAVSTQQVELSVWADSFFTPKWQGAQGPVLDEIWKDFEQKENVKLNLETVPYPEFQAKLLTALSAKNPPDVAIADQYWLASLVSTGGVQEIGDYWPEADRKDFFDWTIDGVTINNKIYGIWYTTDARVFFYRKDLLKAAGYSEPPKTWDELYQMAKKLTTTDTYGMGMALAGEAGMITLLIDYWSLGGELVDISGKPIFNSGKNKEAMIKVMEFYKKLYDEKLIPSDSITYTSENDMNPRIFAGGYAAFFGGGFQIGNIKDNVSKDIASQWDFALRPLPPLGKPASVAGGFDLNVFTADPIKKEKAIKFILHLSNPVNGAKFAAASNGLPVRKSVYMNDSFFATDYYMRKYIDILPYARPRPTTIGYPIISESISKALGEFVSGQKSADQALADAEKTILVKMK